MSYLSHAKNEYRAAGWTNEDGTFKDEMQKMICNHVELLLKVFADEGHSGFSASYALDMFEKLAKFEPLSPLTGEDWEWNEVGRGTFQNKRCSHVFKENGQAYDSEGIIFYDWNIDEETGKQYKTHFTSIDSRVPVVFPYIPKREYRERQ